MQLIMNIALDRLVNENVYLFGYPCWAYDSMPGKEICPFPFLR